MPSAKTRPHPKPLIENLTETTPRDRTQPARGSPTASLPAISTGQAVDSPGVYGPSTLKKAAPLLSSGMGIETVIGQHRWRLEAQPGIWIGGNVRGGNLNGVWISGTDGHTGQPLRIHLCLLGVVVPGSGDRSVHEAEIDDNVLGDPSPPKMVMVSP
jgi:hypothetical protein